MVKNSGYIALISAIIITLVVMVVVSSLSLTGFLSRFNILHSEYKELSVALSESCVEAAILELIEDPNWPGGETINVGSQTCEIRPVQTLGTQRVIETQSEFRESHTNLRVVFDSVSRTLVSWDEVAKF